RKVPSTNECPSGYEAMCVGTTTSQRMERFTRPLMEREGVRIIIGKGGMGQATLDAFRDIGGAYLPVVGGAAALQTTWIESIEEVDMDDLNPESIWRFRIKGFGPLLVTMDSHGGSTYTRIQGDAKARRDAILASIGAGEYRSRRGDITRASKCAARRGRLCFGAAARTGRASCKEGTIMSQTST